MASRGRIAVFSIDAKLGSEVKGATRYTFLAQLLSDHGYDVDFITSRFQHWEKRQRDADFDAGEIGYRVRFIDEPGYPRNICPQRIWSHHIAAKNLARFFESNRDYDLIYCQIPPNDITLTAGRAAKRYGIPFVIDVNDLWPEAFRVSFDVPVLSDFMFAPFLRQARKAYALADAVVGTSDEYASRAFKDRAEDIPKVVVYVGNDIDEFDEGAREYVRETVKPKGELWVSYAGTLSSCYDIDTLIRSVALVQKAHPEIKLKLLGDGVDRSRLEGVARDYGCDVDFLGYLPYKKMAAYLCASDILVNSLVQKAAQSIVTKIGDYLAAGKPLINSSQSPEFSHKVVEDGFGVNVEPENCEALAGAIEALVKDSEKRAAMGRAARVVAETQFGRRVAYRATVDLIDSLVKKRSANQ